MDARTSRVRTEHSRTFLILVLFIATPVLAQTPPADVSRVPGLATEVAKDAKSARSDAEAAAAETDCRGGVTDLIGWQLARVSGGVILQSATQSQQNYTAGLQSFYHRNAGACGWPHQRTFVSFDAAYDAKQSISKPGSIVNRVGNLRLQHLLFFRNNQQYVTLMSDTFHNSSVGVRFQQGAGVGLGRELGAFEVGADIRGIQQQFYKQDAESLIGLLLRVRHQGDLGKAGISSTVELQPIFNETDAWQARAIVGVAIPVDKRERFALNIAAFGDYINNAPSGYRKHYVRTTLTLQFTPK